MPYPVSSGAGEAPEGKNEMTDTTTPAKAKAAGAAPELQEAAPKNKVPANPALVEFPRDEYGTMSNLRRELLLAASTIRGNPEKHKAYLATLGIAAQHAQARLAADAAAIQQEYNDEAERIARANRVGRVAGRPV